MRPWELDRGIRSCEHALSDNGQFVRIFCAVRICPHYNQVTVCTLRSGFIGLPTLIESYAPKQYLSYFLRFGLYATILLFKVKESLIMAQGLLLIFF